MSLGGTRAGVLAFIAALALVWAVGALLASEGPAGEALGVDPATRIEDRPGAIDYFNHTLDLVWDGSPRYQRWGMEPETPIMATDIDLDGDEDLVFGTMNGHVIAVDASDRGELLNVSLPEPRMGHLAVGNLDGDPGREVLCSAGSPRRLWCIDFETGQVQWNSTEYSTGDQIHLVPGGTEGIDDVLLIAGWTLYRLTSDLEEVYNVSLDIFGESLNWIETYILDDVDGDGRTEVVINDKGRTAVGTPRYGRHLWIIDLEMGELEYSHRYAVLHGSTPLPFSWGGHRYLAIGIDEGWSQSWDLRIINLSALDGPMNYTHYRLCDESDYGEFWNHLALVPTDEGPVLFMTSNLGYRVAFSFAEKKALWVASGGSDYRVYTPSVVCDIDNDSDLELLYPLGQVLVYDVEGWTVERTIDMTDGGSSNRMMSVGDFDGDGFVEVCMSFRNLKGEDMVEITTLDTIAPSTIEVELGPRGGEIVLYPGVLGHIDVLVRNVSMGTLPLTVGIDIWHPGLEDPVSIALDLEEWSMDHSGSDLIVCEGFNLTEDERGLNLTLGLMVDWRFSQEAANHMSVTLGFHGDRTVTAQFLEVFRVERRLALTGSLDLRDGERPLRGGQWLAPGVDLLASGFRVVFHGAADLEPWVGAYDLLVGNGLRSWNVSLEEGEPLEVTVPTPLVTGEHVVSIRVYQRFLGRLGPGVLSSTVRVDATPPEFIGSARLSTVNESGLPGPVWYDGWRNERTASITIYLAEDASGLDLEGVRYAFLDSLEDEDFRWIPLRETELAAVPGEGFDFAVTIDPTLQEGRTYILWQASDGLGNSAVQHHVVFIDTKPPVIEVEPPDGWINESTARVWVAVNDEPGSGVDGTTLEFSLSRTEPPEFANWTRVEPFLDEGMVGHILLVECQDGDSNHLALRARDVAGNLAVSEHVTIWVDTTPPEVTFFGVEEGAEMSPGNRRVEFTVEDGGVGLDRFLVALVQEGQSDGGRVEVSVAFDEVTGRHVATWEGVTDPRLRLEVRCRDLLGNEATPSVGFYLNQPPGVVVDSPGNNSVWERGGLVPFHANVTDPDGDDLVVRWWLDDRFLLAEGPDHEYRALRRGNLTVVLEVGDGSHTVRVTIEIVISKSADVDDVPDPGPPPSEDGLLGDTGGLWMLALAAAAAVVVALAYLWTRRRPGDPGE